MFLFRHQVYKGYLSSGESVAIKRANTGSLQGAAEFTNEIELLSRIHHRNVVGLIWFCFKEGEQILVYEYMPNGTLRECLAGQTGVSMDWDRRITLALGSARGIAYLHNEANPPILHRDIKSSNILLDDKLMARVADFGLSNFVLHGDKLEHVSTQVKGTLVYTVSSPWLLLNYIMSKITYTISVCFIFAPCIFFLVDVHIYYSPCLCMYNSVLHVCISSLLFDLACIYFLVYVCIFVYCMYIFPSECTYALTCMCFRPGLCMYNSVLHVCISFYIYFYARIYFLFYLAFEFQH